MIINIQHDIKAIMSEYVKPILTVLLVVKVPDWVKIFFDAINMDNISSLAVFVSQLGGAVYILFKIYDWISEKIKKNENKSL